MTLVIDASITIAWLLTDEATAKAHEILDQVTENGAAVPSPWRLEIANVLRNAVRRGRCDAAFVDESLAHLSALPINIDDATDMQAWGATRRLSLEHDLTLYDAAYLELAVRTGGAIATLDKDLVKAARSRLVEVLTF
jgi:predicted nucleic acid-binding protein